MSNFNLIMLSAWHEQGGNAVLRLLDGHPNLFVYPFESQISTPLSSNILAGPSHWVPQRYSYPRFEMGISPTQAYHSIWDEELKTYLRVRNRSKFKDCGLEMDEADRISRFVEVCQSVRDTTLGQNTSAEYLEAYFRSTFDSWTNFNRTGEETHYVGYSPPISLDADKFFADFPNGHMIHVVRNPFAGYADALKRPFPFSITKYAQIWNVCQVHALAYERKYWGRFHLIRTEDVMEDPMKILNGVLGSVGVAPFVSPPRASFNRSSLSVIRPWGTLEKFDPKTNSETAKELSHDQRRQIECECRDLLKLIYPDQ